MPKRVDYQIISNFIPDNARIIDLGCGNGDLLLKLQKEHNVIGEGVEISDEGIVECIKRGLAVHHADIDAGLSDYADDSFDYVILSQTLQMTHHPSLIIDEMLRVGKKAVISFPNFGYLTNRLQLLLGRMPVSKTYPYEWYDSPNIRFSTISDFRHFCQIQGYRVISETYLSDFDKVRGSFLHNLLSRAAIFVITKEGLS